MLASNRPGTRFRGPDSGMGGAAFSCTGSSSSLPLLLPVRKLPPRTTKTTTRTIKTNAGTIRNELTVIILLSVPVGILFSDFALLCLSCPDMCILAMKTSLGSLEGSFEGLCKGIKCSMRLFDGLHGPILGFPCLCVHVCFAFSFLWLPSSLGARILFLLMFSRYFISCCGSLTLETSTLTCSTASHCQRP